MRNWYSPILLDHPVSLVLACKMAHPGYCGPHCFPWLAFHAWYSKRTVAYPKCVVLMLILVHATVLVLRCYVVHVTAMVLYSPMAHSVDLVHMRLLIRATYLVRLGNRGSHRINGTHVINWLTHALWSTRCLRFALQ